MSVTNKSKFVSLSTIVICVLLVQLSILPMCSNHPHQESVDHFRRHHRRHLKRHTEERQLHKRHHTISNFWTTFNKRHENHIDLGDEGSEEAFEMDDPLPEFTTPMSATTCPSCKNAVRMTEEELTELRIEFVKNQILKKLRMTERPPKINPHSVPSPIADEINFHQSEMEHEGKTFNRLDDYYGKTTQKIIFLNRDVTNCRTKESSKCFGFQMPTDVIFNDVKSAHLWIYKRLNQDDLNQNHTFVVQEIGHWDKEKNFRKRNPLAIHSSDSREEGWIKIGIDWPIKNWFQHHSYQHKLEVICKTCNASSDNDEGPICWENERQPFIVIDTYLRASRRHKRSINCDATHLTSECCREHMYINFTEIGWNDWILYPPGYNAYFCRGQCNSAATVALSESYYNTVLRKVMLQRNKNGVKNLEMIPCCTATQFSSLQLFYMDSNKTGTGKQLPNMVVESCGCM